MDKIEMDILLSIKDVDFVSQADLSKRCGYSLELVNKSLKSLIKKGHLDKRYNLCDMAKKAIKNKSPQNAIILAAGFGMRMVPINSDYPKALLEIKGEVLIERIIRQLKEIGIVDISIVVGFLKEKFEYLIDKYGVKLIINEEYNIKNNLHSLNLASNLISNTYIIPSDIYLNENLFRKNELYSWYMITNEKNKESKVKINKNGKLIKTDDIGNTIIGISYLTDENSKKLVSNINKMDKDSKYNDCFWEEALYVIDEIPIYAREVDHKKAIEINTYEQLREIDSTSNHLKSDAIDTITKALIAKEDDIKNIKILKKGMTNRSFLFECKNKKYIMRIPGEGTDQLINRKEEAEVYDKINGRGICDNIIYINPANGYKITEYLEGSRVCDPSNIDDLKLCMKKLKDFHKLNLEVSHEFDIFKQIDFYESLWQGKKSIYRDYMETKEKVFSLKDYIGKHIERKILCHIDAVCDNFLFTNTNDLRLIDWEYAGMQDPDVDIAMFCIYALYNNEEVERLIDIYFEDKCPFDTRLKIYCYIAACGLLWSNWCEFKKNLGVDFGEYAIAQYAYAKDYYNLFKEKVNEGR